VQGGPGQAHLDGPMERRSLQLPKLRVAFAFGKTFSTFADLLKYQFKLLQFF
jgi:hypothetical protein